MQFCNDKKQSAGIDASRPAHQSETSATEEAALKYMEARCSRTHPAIIDTINGLPSESNGDITVISKSHKWAWKNFPELEAFLVEKRDEYLRHSAMNYTTRQKEYNNSLTDQLLTVARRHNYAFDGADFDFVSIRDRIRCFYKSYVQSNKKKGVIVSYPPLKPKKRARMITFEHNAQFGGDKERLPVDAPMICTSSAS